MYFQRFPKTLYSLDDRDSIQLVTSIFSRVVLSEEIKNNLSIYDEYDIRDGETPEILADILYENSELHWILLHLNDIIDPRFDWPLSTANFQSYILDKYNSINAIHHYEDSDGNVTNGNVYIYSSSGFGALSAGDVITNNTNSGNAVVISVITSSNAIVQISDGGIQTGDNIRLVSNTSIGANITSTSTISGTAVTNYMYENEVNEAKRRIKILKPQYVDTVIKEFNRQLENVNG